MDKIRLSGVVCALLAGAGGLGAQALDVPITVEETAGVRHTAEPVTFGVPLPKNLLRETERLRLYGPGGLPVPAESRVPSRWWEEDGGQNSESLFDRWLLTGDLWSRDVARMSADWAVNFDGLDIDFNTRSIGNGLFDLLKAYEVFGDKKYLDRAQWVIDCVQTWQDGDLDRLSALHASVRWAPKFKGGYSNQSWMYGIALEGMTQASQLLDLAEMPSYVRRAADWVFANPREWDP